VQYFLACLNAGSGWLFAQLQAFVGLQHLLVSTTAADTRTRACPAGAFSWRRVAALGAGAALAASTRPDGEHFVRFVREYTQRGLGFIPGAARACAR